MQKKSSYINEVITDNIKSKWSSFTGLFSIKSWLVSTEGKSDDKNNDPVRTAYLETLAKKRENADRRAKELSNARNQLKATGIKAQYEMENAAAENMHQNMLKQIKAQQDELNKRLDMWKKMSKNIGSGKTVPQDLIEKAVKENDDEIQTIINGLSPDDRSKAQKVQDAFLEAYYVTEKDQYDNEIVRPRTKKEFNDYLDAHKNLKTVITEAAREGRKDISQMTDDELAEFAEAIDAANPATQKDKAVKEKTDAQKAFEEISVLKESVSEEVEKCDKKNKTVENYFNAKKEAEKTKSAAENAKANKDDVKRAIALKLINDNKKSEPFKTIIETGKTNDYINVLINDNCISKNGTVNLNALLVTTKNAYGDKMEKNDNNEPVLPEKLNKSSIEIDVKKAQDAANAAYDEAVKKHADVQAKVTEETEKLKDLDLTTNDIGTSDNPKKFTPNFDVDQKAKLKNLGIEPNSDGEYDASVVQAGLDAQIKNKQTAVENADKKIQAIDDATDEFKQRLKSARQDNEKQKVNDKDREFLDDVKKMSKNTEYAISTVEQKDDNGDVYVMKDGKKLFRPKDITNAAEMKKYQNTVKTEMIKQFMQGDAKEPNRIETELDNDGNPVHYKVSPDGKTKTKIDDIEEAKKIAAKYEQFKRCRAEVYDTLNKMDTDENKEIRDAIQKIIDEDGEAAEKFFKDEDIDMSDFDIDDDTTDDTDDESETDSEKQIKELKKGILKNMSEDDIMDLANKNEKPEGISDEQYKAAKKYAVAKQNIDDNDENEKSDDDSEDIDGKPQKPKRKIRKRPSKRKGFSVYVYKTQEGKLAKASKKDWQANVRAWERYRRRLAKWEKENNKRNESYITKVLSKNLVIERFKPKDLTKYLKECFE